MSRFQIATRLACALVCAGALGFAACSDSSSTCPLPAPFCGTSFPLNTQQTTPYGPAWANVRYGENEWAACFGPYALCYYANCTPTADGTTANCPCYEWFGTSYVLTTSILNLDDYEATRSFCDANPGACLTPNAAPVCQSINSGTYMQGATRISTFSTYRANVEPIGSTDCSSDPGLYAGCMTAPCFGSPVPDPSNHTASITCDCPTFDGPYQVGKSGLSCDDAPLAYSAAYNPNPPDPNPCDFIDGCVPDAPPDQCGCPLYVPGTTVLPPNSGIDCDTVCQQYDSCTDQAGIQIGYTCDASLCTSSDRDIVLPACNGLQNCDLSAIFAAEKAAGCSCCATQLCGCDATPKTDAAVAAANEAQRAQGETPQCDVNGTLCGLPQ
ncbi:MAG TPA: hypothetical protein VFD92_11600 [Candidatus Binatia bacterium]|nr:hypothetical protein [Candidatus Binatia bacterium]